MIQPTPSQPQIPPGTPPVPEPPKTFGWLKWVLIVVVVAFISSGTTYFVLQSKQNQQTQVIPTPSPTETSVKEGNPTANWKTYTNRDDRYTLKYPVSWSIEKASDSATFYPSRIPANVLKQEQKSSPLAQEPNISIYLISTPFKESLALTDKIFIIKPMAIDVDGKRGYYYQSVCAPSCGINVDLPYDDGSKILQLNLFSIGKDNIDRMNKTYRLELQDADEKTFNQILSTFQFTE